MLVAGGSRGIGASAARAAAARGAVVSLTYRADADAARRVVDAIGAAGGTARANQADVAEEASIARAVAAGRATSDRRAASSCRRASSSTSASRT